MYKNKDPSHSDYLFENKPRRWRSVEPDRELLDLEAELRARNLLYDSEIQWLVEKASLCSDKNSRWARDKLRMILEADRIEDMRTSDVFRPLAPAQQLGQGQLHLVTQVDGTPFMIPRQALSRGMLVAGRQGGGKSRFIIWLCRKLNRADPPISWFLIDPKLGFKSWAQSLDAIYLDTDDPDVRIDMTPPPGLTYEKWFLSLAPQIGEIIGVIYGTEILQQAAALCIQYREDYIKKTGRSTEISLQDWFHAVPFVEGVSSGRRSGYKDAVVTGLSRILSGSGELFKCRKGIDLCSLLKRNVILGTRSITDSFAARFLAVFLVWYLHEFDRYAPPIDDPRSFLIIDDAARYIGLKEGFDSGRGLSSLAAALTTLRSSGRCFCPVTQLPHLVDPAVLSLLQTVVQVSGLNYAEDTQIMAKMLGLKNEEQRLALSHLRKREVIARCACSAWPFAVHSYVPDVPDLRE